MHLKRLDGLRGIAIILVVLHHHGLLHSGWVGVDLFFVLSGYLITTGLRADCTNPEFWKRFYLKRCFRILPASLLTLLICRLAFRPPLLNLVVYAASFGDVAAVFGKFWIEPIGIFWSLAVEEHFYFVHPFLIRNLRRERVITALLVVCLLEPILRALFTHPGESYNLIYFFTPFRLDGLAGGSLLALLFESENAREWLRRSSVVLLIMAVGLLALFHFAVPTFNRESTSVLFNSVGYSLVVVAAFSTLSVVLLFPGLAVARVLAWRPLGFIGMISYGIYLSHVMIMGSLASLLRLPTEKVFPITFLATVALSWLSYRFYEKPLIVVGRNLAGTGRAGRNKMLVGA